MKIKTSVTEEEYINEISIGDSSKNVARGAACWGRNVLQFSSGSERRLCICRWKHCRNIGSKRGMRSES